MKIEQGWEYHFERYWPYTALLCLSIIAGLYAIAKAVAPAQNREDQPLRGREAVRERKKNEMLYP